MKHILIHLILTVLCVGTATAAVGTAATCESDTMVITVTFDSALVYQLQDLNIEETLIGSCDGPRLVSSEPVPVAQTDATQTLRFSVPSPLPNRIYHYQTWFRDASGERVPGADAGCSWFAAYGHCGESLAARVKLFDWGTGLVAVMCDGHCWMSVDPSDSEDWTAVEDQLPAVVNTGQVVSIYGIPGPASWPPCTMPGTLRLTVSRIEPLEDPAGCEAVDVRPTSWGDLKSRFR